MARVPVVIQNDQQLQGLSGARFDAPDIGAGGRMVGQSVQRAAGALRQASADVEDTLTIYAEARAKQLDNEYQEFERQTLFGDQGYYSKQNADAIDARKPTEEALNKKAGELLARASDHRERDMLTNVLNRRRNEAFNGINRYAQAETRRFAVQQSDARIGNAQENYATYYWSDPDKAANERATMLNEIDARLDLNGMHDAGIREAERAKALTGMHQSVIETEMIRDPRRAAEYLEEHRAEIDSKVEQNIDARMFPLLADEDARDVSNAAMGIVTETQGGMREDGQPGQRGVAVQILPKGWKAADAANIQKVGNAKQVAEQLFPGIHVTSWKRGKGGAGSDTSHHKDGSGSAVDARPIKGMTFDQYVQKYRDAGYNLIEWIDETDPSTAKKTGATGPHWHVVIGKGGKSSAGETGAGGDLLAPRLEWTENYVAERYGDRPVAYRRMVEDKAKAYIRRDHAEREAAEREREEEAMDVALESVLAQGDNFTDATKVPGYQNLNVRQRIQLDGIAAANVKALATQTKPETQWGFYAEIQQLAADGDMKALRAIPLETARARLDDTEFKEFTKLRAGGKGDSDKALTVDDILKASETSLNAAELVTGNSKDARKSAAEVGAFSRKMMAWAEREKARTGKYPDAEQIRRKADRELIEGTFKAADGSVVRGRAYQNPRSTIDPDIPDDIRARILRKIPRATEAEINQIYVNRKGIDW